MKRYILSIFAVVIAVGMVAFTAQQNKVQPLATKIFQYHAPDQDPYSKVNVEKRVNWFETTLSSTTCNENMDRACQIEVNTSFINPDKTLNSSFLINASQALSGNFYVSGGSADDIFNRD